MLGSAAIDLSQVIEGLTGATIILGSKPWDTSVGVIMAKDAGATVVDIDGSPHTTRSKFTIAAAPGESRHRPRVRHESGVLECLCLESGMTRAEAVADGAVRVLVDALRGDLVPAEYDSLFLGEDPLTDITTTLAMLPADQAGAHLTELCAILDQVNAADAVDVANALLDIVFPDAAYQEGDPLTDPQRTVIHAIADSANVWTFNVNLFEILDRKGLPRDTDELRVLAGGRAAS